MQRRQGRQALMALEIEVSMSGMTLRMKVW